MNHLAKWIGGTTAVALVLAITMLFAGRAIEAQEAASNAADAFAQTSADVAPLPEPVAAPTEAEAIAEEATAPQPVSVPQEPLVIRSILPISGPIKYGEWHWDESRAPAEGKLVMTVDLHARVISVFRDGHEIGAAAALLGTDQHPTPTGTFPILTKERHNVSEKYNNAPMPWTLRLTWDGVAIHGGSTVQLGYASHGCIGVPDQFVSKLYDIAKVGDVVIITDGQTAGLGTSLAAN